MGRSKGYGQFCPVARAAEILAERWTPLVVRELLCGSKRFNDLQRGVPRMSSSLLARRLKELEFAGILERTPAESGGGWHYDLTAAGRELFPIVEGMGKWAQRWVRADLVADENLDPDLLMWDVRRWVTRDGIVSSRRYVVMFEFPDMPSTRRRYWLVFEQDETDLCMKDPGFDVDLRVVAKIKTLTEIWLGHLAQNVAIRDGRLKLDGGRKDQQTFRAWFALSMFAPSGREARGDASPDL